mmetsp:Transcript_7681/g.28805  ORF Transcript_7681/g.28805 Transcript_7681/m.28805 type:complete len:225 (-) Transcript_7681:1823-2497(-)
MVKARGILSNARLGPLFLLGELALLLNHLILLILQFGFKNWVNVSGEVDFEHDCEIVSDVLHETHALLIEFSHLGMNPLLDGLDILLLGQLLQLSLVALRLRFPFFALLKVSINFTSLIPVLLQLYINLMHTGLHDFHLSSELRVLSILHLHLLLHVVGACSINSNKKSRSAQRIGTDGCVVAVSRRRNKVTHLWFEYSSSIREVFGNFLHLQIRTLRKEDSVD